MASALCESLLGSSTPMSMQHSLLSQLQVRFLKVDQGLQISSPQTQRQAHKLMNRLEELVNEFIKKGDLSDKEMERLMKYSAELEVFERRFAEIMDVQSISPIDLNRYLFTDEALQPNFKYNARLPELGEVKVTFSKDVVGLFNQPDGFFRKTMFPLIFRGVVYKTAQDGIKAFTGGLGGILKESEGVEYRLMELKKLGVEGRILIVSTSTGELHFYKYISNHNRIDYVAKEDALQHFLNQYQERD